MNEQQAREDIQIIKKMLEKTRKTTAESGTLFIVWGILIALALVVNYVLVYFQKYNWIWLNWITIAGIGWIYSVIYGIRRERKGPVRSYIQMASRHLNIACGTGYLLVGIAFPGLGVYSHEVIPVLIAAISGILFFVMSGIYEWPLLKWSGLLWWMGAIGMSLVRNNNRTLLFTVLFIAAYLVPAFILRSKVKKEQGRP